MTNTDAPTLAERAARAMTGRMVERAEKAAAPIFAELATLNSSAASLLRDVTAAATRLQNHAQARRRQTVARLALVAITSAIGGTIGAIVGAVVILAAVWKVTPLAALRHLIGW